MAISASVFSLPMPLLSLILLSGCLLCSAFTSKDYSDALEKSILFFEGQRSGKLPSNQWITWRGDSSLSDGLSAQVDLIGGYYDAGDFVKFGFQIAFTTTLLSWSVIEFRDSKHAQIGNAKAAVRWGTDYLLKAATASPGTLYIQMGNPNIDHKRWEIAEDMDTPRDVYKVSSQNPGSDVAADTAAASMVFRYSDPSYSAKLLQTAMEVFDFADKYRGSYRDSLNSAVFPFNCSNSGYYDELLWGASWIYRASQDSSYLNYMRSNGHALGADGEDYSFSWDDKSAGTSILLSKVRSYVQQGSAGGLMYKGSDSNLQYVTSASFLLLTYVKYLTSSRGAVVSCGASTITSEELISHARKQVDYILGDNPARMSYMVGFGPKYPQHIHHRASSIPSVGDHPDRIFCRSGFQYPCSSSPNPSTLVGAAVGGPNSRDNFADDRKNRQQSEPATHVNASLVGALAFLCSSSGYNA